MILADSCQELVDLVGDSTGLRRAKWCQGGLVEAVGGVGCDRMEGGTLFYTMGLCGSGVYVLYRIRD